MKRGDKKFASNTSLFCCSEHFSEKDYRKSLTGKRHDLVTNAVPSIFPWSVPNDEVSERSERAKSRRLRAHQRVWKTNIILCEALDISKRRLKTKI